MAKYMMIGDTHGMVAPLAHKLQIAETHGITNVFIMGDFGLWPGMGGMVFLDEINRAANNHKVNIWAIPGNHEDHDQWEWWLDSSMPKANGFTAIRSRVWISPKVNFFKMDGKRFGVAGGAVSIDKAWRKPYESWWPNETLSEKNIESIMSYDGPKLDYLLTHDASDHTDWGFNLVPDPDSRAHRQVIDKVINHLQPKFHWHGHMHHKYDWVNTASHGLKNTAFGYDDSEHNGASTHTYGLDCNGEIDSWGILNTPNDKFKWGSRIHV